MLDVSTTPVVSSLHRKTDAQADPVSHSKGRQSMNTITLEFKTPEIIETYKADGIHACVQGRYRTCRVYPNGTGGYIRKTHNGAKAGIRYHRHATYDSAIAGALAWGGRLVSR